MWTPPLLVLPLIVYNVVAFGLVTAGDAGWATTLVSLSMISGGVWTLSMGDGLALLALALLFFEVVKSARGGASAVSDHLLSTLVFVAYLVEFLVVTEAATSLFFLCLAMSFMDMVAGFTVSIRASGRNFSS